MKFILAVVIIIGAMLIFTANTSEPEPAKTSPAPPTATPIVSAQTTSPQVTQRAKLPTPTSEPAPDYSEAEAEMLAKMVWGEARGCTADEQRLVVWTVFQRVDGDDWGDTIEAVVTARAQFHGYDTNNPILLDIYDLCAEELIAWHDGAEPPTHELYAPTAPYYYFEGDGLHNYFRKDWR
jgi:hypothetical protein